MSYSPTLKELKGWFDNGFELGATHMAVIVDRFSWEDYPVYIYPGQDSRKIVGDMCTRENMQGLMELYDLSKGFDEQRTRKGFVINF